MIERLVADHGTRLLSPEIHEGGRDLTRRGPLGDDGRVLEVERPIRRVRHPALEDQMQNGLVLARLGGRERGQLGPCAPRPHHRLE
ncbi:MAG: hypothetical protein ACREFN_01555, partial [Acetobacteraceae bacterium]